MQGRFRRQSLAHCARENQARHVRQISSNGVMDESSRKDSEGERSLLPTAEQERSANGNVSKFASNGVMDKDSGKVQKVNAHRRSSIMVDGAVVEGHITALDAEASTLPNKEGACQGKVIQRGDG